MSLFGSKSVPPAGFFIVFGYTSAVFVHNTKGVLSFGISLLSG
jgi:hypothetical protein